MDITWVGDEITDGLIGSISVGLNMYVIMRYSTEIWHDRRALGRTLVSSSAPNMRTLMLKSTMRRECFPLPLRRPLLERDLCL